MIAIVLSSVVSAVVCVGIYVLVTRFITKNTIRAQREAALKEAEAEGEMIKKERILQAKEKNMKGAKSKSSIIRLFSCLNYTTVS